MNRVDEFRDFVMNNVVKYMPQEYLLCLACSSFLSFEQFADYVMFEIIKEAYYRVTERHSLRFYLKELDRKDDASERMKYSRTISFAQKYRTKEQKQRREARQVEIQELNPKDMSTLEQKKAGYDFNELQFFELSNMQSIGLIKSLVEKRFMDAKKVSNSKAKDLLKEYENWMSNLIISDESQDEEVVFNSLAAFTFEWKFVVEYVYEIATYMEEHDISNYDLRKIAVLCADLTFVSPVTGEVSTHSRMVKERIENVKYLFEMTEEELDDELFIWNEYVNLKSYIICNVQIDDLDIVDKFIEETELKDWADFLRDYNVFGMYRKDKHWSGKKLRYMRRIFSELLVG